MATRSSSTSPPTGRVDFRELVKDLAGVFRTRIELRQIGVRDESKMLGGLGILRAGRSAARPSSATFQPVVDQDGQGAEPLPQPHQNLRHLRAADVLPQIVRQAAYEDLIRTTPKVGAAVVTPDGPGTVTEVALIQGLLKVQLEANPDAAPSVYPRESVKWGRDLARGRRGKGEKGERPADGKRN